MRGKTGRCAILPALCLAAVVTLIPLPARCQPLAGVADSTVPSDKVSALKAQSLARVLKGEWVGARLLCRKEEDSAVRCGKPVNFSVIFNTDGTGSSTDEHFPNYFAYQWKSDAELVLTSGPGGDELTLFQFEIKEGFLSFQTYIYLAIKDPALPKEANYIHYIFDVHRID
jgi:hypothetical protein